MKRCVQNVRAFFINLLPTGSELDVIEEIYGKAWFHGCIGEIYCMKFSWENCLFSLKGKFHSIKDENLATIQVETWAYQYLYVWNWLVGIFSTNKNMKMVATPPIFCEILCGVFD